MGRIGQEWDARTYVGAGPHPSDPRAVAAAAEIIELIEGRRRGSGAEHVGSTAVPDLVGKNFVDLQITADPEDVPSIADTLLGLGFVRQRGPDAWPPERPMLEGTYRCRGAVFGVHAHVVPSTDPDVNQMAAFRDLLRRDRDALETYAAEKRRILERTDDVREYTDAKTDVIARLLAHRSTTAGSKADMASRRMPETLAKKPGLNDRTVFERERSLTRASPRPDPRAPEAG